MAQRYNYAIVLQQLSAIIGYLYQRLSQRTRTLAQARISERPGDRVSMPLRIKRYWRGSLRDDRKIADSFNDIWQGRESSRSARITLFFRPLLFIGMTLHNLLYSRG